MSLALIVLGNKCIAWCSKRALTVAGQPVLQVNEFVKRIRAAKIHILIMGHLRKEMPSLIGKAKAQEKLLAGLAEQFVQIQREYHLPPGALPNHLWPCCYNQLDITSMLLHAALCCCVGFPAPWSTTTIMARAHVWHSVLCLLKTYGTANSHQWSHILVTFCPVAFLYCNHAQVASVHTMVFPGSCQVPLCLHS